MSNTKDLEYEVYHDKHGERILRAMFIRHDNGEVEKVYATDNKDLGVNASNEAWLERTGRERELYPLYQFDLSEWEIVKK